MSEPKFYSVGRGVGDGRIMRQANAPEPVKTWRDAADAIEVHLNEPSDLTALTRDEFDQWWDALEDMRARALKELVRRSSDEHE